MDRVVFVASGAGVLTFAALLLLSSGTGIILTGSVLALLLGVFRRLNGTRNMGMLNWEPTRPPNSFPVQPAWAGEPTPGPRSRSCSLVQSDHSGSPMAYLYSAPDHTRTT
jgi:hypothetical protein